MTWDEVGGFAVQIAAAVPLSAALLTVLITLANFRKTARLRRTLEKDASFLEVFAQTPSYMPVQSLLADRICLYLARCAHPPNSVGRLVLVATYVAVAAAIHSGVSLWDGSGFTAPGTVLALLVGPTVLVPMLLSEAARRDRIVRFLGRLNPDPPMLIGW